MPLARFNPCQPCCAPPAPLGDCCGDSPPSSICLLVSFPDRVNFGNLPSWNTEFSLYLIYPNTYFPRTWQGSRVHNGHTYIITLRLVTSGRFWWEQWEMNFRIDGATNNDWYRGHVYNTPPDASNCCPPLPVTWAPFWVPQIDAIYDEPNIGFGSPPYNHVIASVKPTCCTVDSYVPDNLYVSLSASNNIWACLSTMSSFVITRQPNTLTWITPSAINTPMGQGCCNNCQLAFALSLTGNNCLNTFTCDSWTVYIGMSPGQINNINNMPNSGKLTDLCEYNPVHIAGFITATSQGDTGFVDINISE